MLRLVGRYYARSTFFYVRRRLIKYICHRRWFSLAFLVAFFSLLLPRRQSRGITDSLIRRPRDQSRRSSSGSMRPGSRARTDRRPLDRAESDERL